MTVDDHVTCSEKVVGSIPTVTMILVFALLLAHISNQDSEDVVIRHQPRYYKGRDTNGERSSLSKHLRSVD